MSEAVSEIEKVKAALAREQVAVQTARDEAQHWKAVAEKLSEQLKAAKRIRGEA